MSVAALALRTDRALPAHPTFADAANAHLDAVVRYLRQMTGDPFLAEDLASETFERALRVWDRYDARRGPVLPWLITIARRIALDHFRSDRRRRVREERVAAMGPTSHPAPTGPTDLPPEMAAALSGLSDTEREVVALRVLLDMDGAETAAILGITTSACSTHLHRAMTKLRAELQP